MTMFFGPRGEIVKGLLDILHEIRQYDEDLVKLEKYENYILGVRIRDKRTILKEEERDLQDIQELAKTMQRKITRTKQLWNSFEKALKNLDKNIANSLYFENNAFNGKARGTLSLMNYYEKLIGTNYDKLDAREWGKLKTEEARVEIRHIADDVRDLLVEIKRFYLYTKDNYDKNLLKNAVKVYHLVYQYFGAERRHELGKGAQE
jgi:hypothetical protein